MKLRKKSINENKIIISDTPFPPNHPLGMLTALNMGVPNLHSFQQQHNDVLEKIKMQVRDMKVGFMNSDFSALHPSFTSTLQSTLGFNPQQLSAQNNNQNSSALQLNSGNNNESLNGHFPFSSPTAAANKDGKWTFKEFNYSMINEFCALFPSHSFKLINVK